MSIPIGITVPKLLPITGTFAPAFAFYHIFLAMRVSLSRIDSQTWIGGKDSSSAPATSDADPILLTSRCHANFTENVPLALLLGTVVELNGGNRKVLTAGLVWLFAARVVHVELGLRKKDADGNAAMGLGRPVGHFSTLGIVAGFGGYAAWLVRGYWGL